MLGQVLGQQPDRMTSGRAGRVTEAFRFHRDGRTADCEGGAIGGQDQHQVLHRATPATVAAEREPGPDHDARSEQSAQRQ
jgi:hypothetical protein